MYSKSEFDHAKFFDWVEASTHPVYFSEYQADDRFELVFGKPRKQRLIATEVRKSNLEKVFANKTGVEALNVWRTSVIR